MISEPPPRKLVSTMFTGEEVAAMRSLGYFAQSGRFAEASVALVFLSGGQIYAELHILRHDACEIQRWECMRERRGLSVLALRELREAGFRHIDVPDPVSAEFWMKMLDRGLIDRMAGMELSCK